MKRVFILAGLFVVSFTNLNGQITPNIYKSMEYRREIQKIIGKGIINRKILGSSQTNANSNKSAPTATPTATGTTAFKFSAKYLLPDLILADYQGNARDKIAAAKEISDLIDSYKATAAKDGFPANDLAYSFNFFIIHNLIIYQGVKCTALELGLKGREDSCSIFTAHNYTLDQERGIYHQFRKTLDTPATAKMSDGEKQLMAEQIAVKTNELWNRWAAQAARSMTIENYNIKMEAAKNLEDLLQIPANQISVTNDGIKF